MVERNTDKVEVAGSSPVTVTNFNKNHMATKLDADRCPKCGHLFNSATCVDETKGDIEPTAGDISLCVNCAAILEFDENLKLRMCDDKTINELDDELLNEIIKVKTSILSKVKYSNKLKRTNN